MFLLDARDDFLHAGIDVRPKLFKAAAEIVEPRFTRRRPDQAVLLTISIAGEEIFAGAAIFGELVNFGETEFALLVREHHLRT